MKKIKVLSHKDRTRIINRVGFIDTITNLFLGLTKLFIAIVSGSMAIGIDSVLNLGDFASGIITMIGIKVSEHKPTAKHPFGFGRIEYMTTIVVSLIMILVAGEFARISLININKPNEINLNNVQVVILSLVVIIKFGLFYLNKRNGEKTDSQTLEGTALDSFIAACGTALTVFLVLLDKYIHLNLDGWISLGVAVFIIISCLIDIYKIINLMLGTNPDPELIKKIKETALSVEPIEGVNNIIIHSYGYFVHYGQMDVELPDNMDIRTASKVLQNLKTVLEDQYEIEFTFGLWPENITYKNTIHQFRSTDKGVTVSKRIHASY